MQPPDDTRQTPDVLEEVADILEPDTGVLERDTGVIEGITRPHDSYQEARARRQHILQQKQSLPASSLPGSGSSRNLWRQLALLRDENQQLRREVETLRAQVNASTPPIADISGDAAISSEIETIHRGYQQEIQQYQSHLADLMEERNRLQKEYHALESRYHDLYYNFLASLEEEAHRMVTEAARTITLSPTGGETHPLFQDVVQALATHAQQLENEHVAHTLYLMREAQRKAAQLEEELQRERQQLLEERQNLIAQQQSIRQQARQRYQAIQTRLQARWLLRLITVVGVLLVFLLVVQLLGLSLFQVPVSPPLLMAVIAPVFLCPIVASLWVYLRQRIRFLYHGAPHRKKTRKLSEFHA